MTQNRDSSALLDIYQAANKVVEFSRGFDQPSFLADERTQSAILHQLLIIGEAVKRLSAEFRRSHPHIRPRISPDEANPARLKIKKLIPENLLKGVAATLAPF